MRHWWARRSIRRHLAGDLPESARLRLYTHLRGCEECRAELDAAAELLRGLAGRTPTQAEDRAWEERLLTLLEPPAAQRGRRQPYLAAAAACAMLLLCLGLALWPRVADPPPRTLRGGSGPALAAIEVFAIAGRAQPAARRLEDGDRVSLDEYIQIQYRNHSSGLRYLFVLGIDRRRQPLDYFPRPDSTQSIPVGLALDPRPLPRSIRLRSRHQTGPLTVVGVFSERPLSRQEVHQRILDLKLGAAGQAPPADALGPGVLLEVRHLQVVSEAP